MIHAAHTTVSLSTGSPALDFWGGLGLTAVAFGLLFAGLAAWELWTRRRAE
jgi:hypothetical protein